MNPNEIYQFTNLPIHKLTLNTSCKEKTIPPYRHAVERLLKELNEKDKETEQ